MGTFHVRLLEGKELRRAHWSALSLGPARLLGLSSASGEVSSFGSFRLAFWGKDNDQQDGAFDGNLGGDGEWKQRKKMEGKKSSSLDTTDSMTPSCSSSSGGGLPFKSVADATNRDTTSRVHSFLPSMPSPLAPSNTLQKDVIKSPLTPFDQGCLASMSPARSPFFPAFAQQQTQKQNNNAGQQQSNPHNNSQQSQSQPFPLPSEYIPPKSMPTITPTFPGPTPPHHYAKEQFRSSVIHNDSNPIWGDPTTLTSSSHHDATSQNTSTFRIPLRKDDMHPSLQSDGARIALEIRLDEEMAPTESILVGGALSHAVGAAAAATSLVPVVGRSVGEQAHRGATVGMEMLGLGTDRLIGKGYVDLMPLLLGVWEEEWEKENFYGGGNHAETTKEAEADAQVDEYGRIPVEAYRRRRRVERMGMLDVWVPLYRPANNNTPSESRGKVHLLISYEPNGMSPKPNDVVALESFARRPHSDTPSLNVGSLIAPILPPLSPRK